MPPTAVSKNSLAASSASFSTIAPVVSAVDSEMPSSNHFDHSVSHACSEAS